MFTSYQQRRDKTETAFHSRETILKRKPRIVSVCVQLRLSLKQGTGNGGMGNGERGTGNGESLK